MWFRSMALWSKSKEQLFQMLGTTMKPGDFRVSPA